MDVSIALLKGKEYVVPKKDMDLIRAFRLRAPSLAQQRIHAEGNTTIFRLHFGKCSRCETAKDSISAPFVALGMQCAALYSGETFYAVAFSLDDGEEKDAFA